jgi:hypothetical protein
MVATIVLVPDPTAVSSPVAEIVATATLLDVHVTWFVTFDVYDGCLLPV